MNDLRGQLRRSILGMLRHKWVIVALAWLISAVGWAAVSSIPNRYEASARIFIDADAVLTPLLHGIALDNPLSAQIDVLQRTLLSRPNIEKLISKTDLSLQLRQSSDLEQMVASLGSQIAVVPQTRNLFTITYRNENPRLAYDVVRTILGIFVEDKAGTSRSDMANARTFLDDQIAGYEKQLQAAEAKRAEFRAQYVDILPSEGSGATKLDGARDAVRRLEGQLADARARHDRLTQELAITPATIVTETDPGGAAGVAGQSALAAAQARLRELQATLTDQHPDVIQQRQLIAALRAGGGAASSPASTAAPTAARPGRNRVEPNVVYQQLKVMLVQADTDAASLLRQVTDAHGEQDRLEQIARGVPTVQAQSINLNRDYEVLRKNYDELLARRESMRLANAADTQADKVKLQIVDPPKIPEIPVSPKRGLLLTAVFLGALGGGVAGAFLLSQLDRSFHTVVDLHAMGLPVAGSISLLDAPLRSRGMQWIKTGTALASLLLLGLVYGGLMYRIISLGTLV